MSNQVNSEQALIGSILRDNDLFDNLDIDASDFLREDHRIIYQTSTQMISGGLPCDLILLSEALDRSGDLERVGGLSYISELVSSATASKNIKYYEKIVKSSSKTRQLKRLLASLNDSIDSRETVDELLEKAETGLFNLLENKDDGELSHVSESVRDAINWSETNHKGLSTGLRDLDMQTNGLNKANLIIIAGRPSMGKSSLVGQMAEHVAKDETVAFFSLEMQKRELAARMLKFHDSQVGRKEAIEFFSSLKLHIDDKPGITLSHVRSQCRKIKRKHGLGMIVIDYLQLMVGKGDNRTQEVGALSRGLKGIAKEFDIPVVLLSQLNRGLEARQDKRPIMSDLRESGEIEQDADIILFIYRDEVYNEQTEHPGIAEIICRKNRNGSTGTTMTKWIGELTRFENYDGERITYKEVSKETFFKDF